MNPSVFQTLEQDVIPLLRDTTGYEVERVADNKAPADFYVVMRHGRKEVKLMVECKWDRSLLSISRAADRLKSSLEKSKLGAYPLLVVPYMSDAGQGVCREEGVNWIDLSGNMELKIPPIAVHVEGKPNKFPVRGKLPNVFRGKSQKLIRVLLEANDQAFRHSELVELSHLDKAQVSRILQKLTEDGSVLKDKDGLISVVDPSRLLTAWRAAYDFESHEILMGHLHGRTPEDRTVKLMNALEKAGISYAFTGLPAAQAYTEMLTSYRLASVYVSQMPSHSTLEELVFSPEPRGANTWFVIPRDESILGSIREIAGLRVVSPIQTYLDLKAHPERAESVAEEVLRIIEDEWHA